MKNVKMISFVSITLTFLLLFGQSYGVSAIIDQGSRTRSMTTSSFDDTSEFGVDIWFVGYGSTEGQRLMPGNDGTYHYITDNAGTLNLVRIKTNITGFTCWGNCSDTNLATTEGEMTVGQMFLVVDGLVSPIGNGFLSSSGSDVGLIGLGTHIISILYAGKDATDGFVYASDTIIVRVGTSEEGLGAYGTVTADFSHTITDVATEGKNITAAASYYDPYWGSWTRESQFDAFANVSLAVDGTPQQSYEQINLDFENSVLSLSGEVNSTGFDGYQVDGTWDSTIGHMFLIDGTGLHYMDGSQTTVTLTDTIFSNNPAINAEVFSATYVGVLVLAEYGRWVKNYVSYPSWQGPFADYEGLNSVRNTTVANVTTGEIDGGSISMGGSFDFEVKSSGSSIWVAKAAATTEYTDVWTYSTDTTITSSTTGPTVTSNTTITESDTLETNTVTESPGFGVIVSLLTIGVIAFAAPRLRREN